MSSKYHTATIIHVSALTPELLAWATDHNNAGNGVQILMLGDEFVRTTTLLTEDVEAYAAELGKSVVIPQREQDEETVAYVERMKPQIFAAFDGMRKGAILALHMTIEDFLLMKAQPEFIAASNKTID